MLASITPLGERGRHATWGVTVTAFLLGSVLAGLLVGAALGAAGSVALPPGLGQSARLIVLAVALAVAVAIDASPIRVPGPARQVNERWLDEYRGWVYGLGYGAQLGLGVTTVVSSAATYVALIAAFLTASPAWGAVVLGCFGAVRGLTPIAAASVRTPEGLIAVHRALARLRAPVRWGGVVALAAVLGASVAGGVA
jgi:hypothetical protein